jgi:hypothetical protein
VTLKVQVCSKSEVPVTQKDKMCEKTEVPVALKVQLFTKSEVTVTLKVQVCRESGICVTEGPNLRGIRSWTSEVMVWYLDSFNNSVWDAGDGDRQCERCDR